jgi:PAS domain S-box-containing protein
MTDRNAAEEDRIWLEKVVQSLQDAIVGVTLDCVIRSWSAGAERFFGYTAEEIIGRSAAVLRPPGSEDVIAGMSTRIGRGEHLRNRFVWVRKDRTTATLMTDSSPILDDSGVLVGMAMVARDLGEHERADAMFRSLVEAAPDAMVCIDDRGVIAMVNFQAERLFGYARDELIGRAVNMLVADPARDGHSEKRWEYFAQFESGQIGESTEIVARRKDGSDFLAEISMAPVESEQGMLMSATVRDGTVRREAAIVASSSDAIVGRDLDGMITSWNAGATQMYGYSAAEAIGEDMLTVLPPDHLGELLDLTGRVQRGEPVDHYETQRVRKDGVTIEISASMSPIRDDRGAVVGSSTVSRDITQSKRAVQALEALEARHSAILQSALDCIITMDYNGRVVEFNPAAERTFGYARDDVVGRTMAELIIPPSLRDRHAGGLARYLATGTGPILGQRLELMAMRADGSEFPIELAVTKVELPGEPLFTGYLRDLTKQKRLQGKLGESQHLLEAMLDNSPALICLTGTDGRCLFISRSLADTFGLDAEAAKGQAAGDFWSEGADGYRARDREVVEAGAPMQYELVAVTPGGDRTYLAVKFPVFSVAGTIYAICSIATDITDRKAAEAERELLGERRRQSERLESLGQLAGGVAHDFNNLLGAILNYAAFVAEDTVDNPTVSADVEQIRAAAERAARLTRQLLIVGRREAIQTEILEPNAIIADIRDLLSRTIGEHIELIVRTTPELPTIRGDRGQIEQVLLNLAVNARDAMPSGGIIAIATAVADLDDEFVRLHPDAKRGRHVELSVSDTGVGIPPEVVTHIFEPFFTTKPKGHGTGLGLATVYGIVTEAGGTLSVYSEPGTGSTFRVLLPAIEEPAAIASAPIVKDIDGHGETILVVDDDPALLESTARMLRRHGYAVHEAGSGTRALAIASRQDLDLLVTDSVMPHMSGRDLAGRMAELRPHLPVLFMSGYSQGVIGPQGIIDEGAVLVEKPFTAMALLTGVREAMSRGHTLPTLADA